jgi:hypothetical protein
MGILRNIILGADKNDKEMQEDFDEFMAIEKKRKEEIKNKKRSIFSIDEEVEGNDDMFDDVDFLQDEKDNNEEER